MLETPAQIFISDIEQISIDRMIRGAIAGALYNAAAYSNTWSKTGDKWSPREAAQTYVLGIAAGILAACMHPQGPVSETEIEFAIYLLAPVADQFLNAKTNLGRQIEHNQLGQLVDSWFEDGRSPGTGTDAPEFEADPEIDPATVEQAAESDPDASASAPDPERDPTEPTVPGIYSADALAERAGDEQYPSEIAPETETESGSDDETSGDGG